MQTGSPLRPSPSTETQNALPDGLKFLFACCRTESSGDDIEAINAYLASEHLVLDELIGLANMHGVIPLVYKTLKKLSEENRLDVLPPVLDAFKEVYMQVARRNMLMSAELLRIMKLLEDIGIEALAFKGPALAQQAYGDITMRQFVDLDVLVRTNVLFEAVELLKQHGFSTVYPLNESQFKVYAHIAHDYALQKKRSLVTLELHWRLLSDEFMVDVSSIDFFANPADVLLQNRVVYTLAPEELLLYLCIHAAKHQWERLGWVVDIVLLVEKGVMDWGRLLELMHRTRSDKIVLSALYLCRALFGTSLPDAVGIRLEEKKIKRVSMHLLMHFSWHYRDRLDAKVQTKTVSLLQWRLLDGVKNRWLFLSSFFRPTQLDFLGTPLPEKLTFLYYFMRPYNIMKRWSGKLGGRKKAISS